MRERLLLPYQTRLRLQKYVYNRGAPWFPFLLATVQAVGLAISQFLASMEGHLDADSRTFVLAPVSFTYNQWPEFWANWVATALMLLLGLRRFAVLTQAVKDFQTRNRDFFQGLPPSIFSDERSHSVRLEHTLVNFESFIKLTGPQNRPRHRGDTSLEESYSSYDSSLSFSSSSSLPSSENIDEDAIRDSPHNPNAPPTDPDRLSRHVPRGGLLQRPMLTTCCFFALVSAIGLAVQATIPLPRDSLARVIVPCHRPVDDRRHNGDSSPTDRSLTLTVQASVPPPLLGNFIPFDLLENRTRDNAISSEVAAPELPRDLGSDTDETILQEDEVNQIFSMEGRGDKKKEYPVRIPSAADLGAELAPFLFNTDQSEISTSEADDYLDARALARGPSEPALNINEDAVHLNSKINEHRPPPPPVQLNDFMLQRSPEDYELPGGEARQILSPRLIESIEGQAQSAITGAVPEPIDNQPILPLTPPSAAGVVTAMQDNAERDVDSGVVQSSVPDGLEFKSGDLSLGFTEKEVRDVRPAESSAWIRFVPIRDDNRGDLNTTIDATSEEVTTLQMSETRRLLQSLTSNQLIGMATGSTSFGEGPFRIMAVEQVSEDDCHQVQALPLGTQTTTHSIGMVMFVTSGLCSALLLTVWLTLRYMFVHACGRPAYTLHPSMLSVVLKMLLIFIPPITGYQLSSRTNMHPLERAGLTQRVSIACLLLFVASLGMEISSLRKGIRDSYHYVRQNHIGRHVAFCN